MAYATAVTRSERLTRDDYQAAMAALDWQDRRAIERSSWRGGILDDPTHAALAAERARRASTQTSWALLFAPLAGWLLWTGLQSSSALRLWSGGFWAALFLVAVYRVVGYQRARSEHLMTADFDGLRDLAAAHRERYRRRE